MCYDTMFTFKIVIAKKGSLNKTKNTEADAINYIYTILSYFFSWQYLRTNNTAVIREMKQYIALSTIVNIV